MKEFVCCYTLLIFSVNIYGLFLWKKKVFTVTNAFQTFLDESNRKPNKIWVEKGNKFYSILMKSWLEKNDMEMYSAHNERKSVVAERFVITLKKKNYKHVTSISKS